MDSKPFLLKQVKRVATGLAIIVVLSATLFVLVWISVWLDTNLPTSISLGILYLMLVLPPLWLIGTAATGIKGGSNDE